MKIKTFTISKESLNSGTVMEFEAYVNITQVTTNEGTKTIPLYPREIELYNDSGAAFYINVMTSGEYTDYKTDPTLYALKKIPNNFNYGNDRDAYVSKPYRILVKGSTGHSSGTVLELIGLMQSQAR